MQVREVMKKDVKVIQPDSVLSDAARQMRDDDIGVLPVCDSDRLVGMLTDRDIAIRAVADGKDASTFKVREAMTSEILTCHEDDDIDDITQLMSDRQVHRVPVLDRNNRLVGIVSLADLARKNRSGDNANVALSGISEERHDEPGQKQSRH